MLTTRNSLMGDLLRGTLAEGQVGYMQYVLLGCFSKRSSMGMGQVSTVTREQKYHYGINTRAC